MLAPAEALLSALGTADAETALRAGVSASDDSRRSSSTTGVAGPDGLSDREREVLRLTYYEELSKEEISERLGIIPERVRLVKSRALASFRDFYGRLTEGKRK